MVLLSYACLKKIHHVDNRHTKNPSSSSDQEKMLTLLDEDY